MVKIKEEYWNCTGECVDLGKVEEGEWGDYGEG